MDPSRERDFTAFYDATWPRTVACAYALTGDLGEAQDLAQEAYSRAWPRWSSLHGYDDPGAWVRHVATRLAVSRWRRARTAAVFLARSRGPEPAAPPSESTTALVAALKQLPEAQPRTFGVRQAWLDAIAAHIKANGIGHDDLLFPTKAGTRSRETPSGPGSGSPPSKPAGSTSR